MPLPRQMNEIRDFDETCLEGWSAKTGAQTGWCHMITLIWLNDFSLSTSLVDPGMRRTRHSWFAFNDANRLLKDIFFGNKLDYGTQHIRLIVGWDIPDRSLISLWNVPAARNPSTDKIGHAQEWHRMFLSAELVLVLKCYKVL